MNSSEFLEKAREFMTENGFDVPVQVFLDSDKVRTFAYEQLDSMKSKADVLTSNVPESLKEKAAEMNSRMKEMKLETFMKDIKSSFICNIYDALMGVLQFSETYAFQWTIIETVKLAVSDENDRAVELTTQIMEEYAESCINIFVSELYNGYVPEGIPGEVMNFIHGIAGGAAVYIPTEVITQMHEMTNNEPKDD